MTKVTTTYNRRSFFKVSALASGGMVLGFSWLASCTPSEKEVKAPPKEWFDINAYLKIGDNGMVTIISPNPEIGQNVKTAMPMIIAEELDIDWDDVTVEQGGLDTDVFTRQIAGGSQSIRKGWESLRMAGATARNMLLTAAATQLAVPIEELTTSKGVITHQASGQTLGYGEVAAAASQLPVPESVELRDPKDFTIIGTDRLNVDTPKIIKGEPLFGLDVDREGMKIAMIVHPPAFGMKLKSFDATVAKAMPGITDVISIDVSGPEGGEAQWSEGPNAFPQLVAVVGNSTWEVMKAKKTLEIEWETTGKLESTEDHEAALSALLGQAPKKPSRKDGNPAAAFKTASQVIERTYHAPFLPHNCMEPMNFFAHVTADHAELLGPIQTPEALSKTVSRVCELPLEKVSVMMTRQGGGFGRRLYGNFGIEAAVISQQLHVPIKLIYTREDDMTQGSYRPAYKVTYKAGLNESGELVAFHVRGVGAHGSPLFVNRYPAGAVDNYLAEEHAMPSAVTTAAWRAPRSNFIAGAEQSFLNEVAELAGKDPIDFRLELFQRAMDNPVGEKNDYDAARYAGVLELVKEKSNWGQETPGVYRGVSAYYCHNSYVAQVVDVVMDGENPKIQKVWNAVDCGIVVNPISAKNLMEGGAVDGIGHAMYSGLTFKDGQPQQANFGPYRMIRHSQAPLDIETHFVDNGIDPTGLGEPGMPPVIGALATALSKATGTPRYRQPFVGPQPEPILSNDLG